MSDDQRGRGYHRAEAGWRNWASSSDCFVFVKLEIFSVLDGILLVAFLKKEYS